MPDIKTREHVKNVKVIDKAAVAGERMRTAFVRTKDQTQNLMDDGQASPHEYAEDQLRYAAEDVVHDVGHEVKRGTKKAVNKAKEAHRQQKEAKRAAEKAKETTQETAKRTTDTVKQTTNQVKNTADRVKQVERG